MIAHSRALQIFQGIISLILGGVSILLAILLMQYAYPIPTLIAFFIVGLTLIFSGDYLINPFRMPVETVTQQILSEVCVIGYGTFYVTIGLSRLLQPRAMFNMPHFLDPIWIRRGLSSIGILLIIGGIYGIFGILKKTDTDSTE